MNVLVTFLSNKKLLWFDREIRAKYKLDFPTDLIKCYVSVSKRNSIKCPHCHALLCVYLNSVPKSGRISKMIKRLPGFATATQWSRFKLLWTTGEQNLSNDYKLYREEIRRFCLSSNFSTRAATKKKKTSSSHVINHAKNNLMCINAQISYW